jgi:PKD repeat protein
MAGTPVSFNAGGSSDPQGQPLTYAWTFGDGSTGTGLTTTHTYAAPGTYAVTVTVKDTSGLTGFASSGATIAAGPPVASAGGPYSGTVGLAVSFSGSGSSDPQGQALTYAWNFGDGSTGTGVTPSHTYTAAGTYTVTLTVTDASGLTGAATSHATIVAQPVAALTGIVSGGTAPVVGAHVYLLAANTIGYGQASLSLLSAALTGSSDSIGAYVVTGSNGGFSLTGEYDCASGQQLYLYALGGNAGSGANAASGLMAAIGTCPSNTAPAVFATVNEVSTVATAYAMAGFATDATHVSSSGTALAQVGVANAFANAGNLATLATGVALAATPAGNGVVPQAGINTLANILAHCIDAVSSCNSLLSTATSDGTPTGTKPTDTATAAINMAHHPGVNVAALYGLSTSAVFSPQLTAQPNDFTIGLQFTGGGLSEPQAIAIDGSGNAWVPNFGNIAGVASNSVTELSSLGSLTSGANGYTGGGLNHPTTIAIDPLGNAWTLNPVASSVIEISSSGSILSGAGGFTGGGLSAPEGLAIDGSGNVWIGNGSSLTELSNSGSPAAGSPLTGGGLGSASAVAVDGSGNVWAPDAFTSRVAEFSKSGSVLSGANGYSGGGMNFPDAIAIDGSGDAWMLNSSNCSCVPGGSLHVVELSSSGSSLGGATGYFVPSLAAPTGIAIDGGENVWITNYSSGSLTELSNTGAVLSPQPSDYTGPGLNGPGGVAIDGSGDVWVANNGNKSVTEVIGLAVPVVTPLSVGVKNNALGTRP